MTITCKECKGTGSVIFTKERGGPVCNNCGGMGTMTPKILQSRIASILYHPSLYMGGPSQQSLRRAKKIIEYLQDQNILTGD